MQIVLALVTVGCGDDSDANQSADRVTAQQMSAQTSRKATNADATASRNPVDNSAENATAFDTKAECIGADTFTCEVEAAIVRLTNELRPTSSPLKHHAALSYVARDWSRQQAERGSLSHAGFPQQRSDLYRTTFSDLESMSFLAENVAYFGGGANSAEDVAQRFVDMWAGSFGHRRNMLGSYTWLGAGVFKIGNAYYGTQIFAN